MAKLVVLKFIDGSFERGFTVMLQIGDEAARPSIETTGRLPPLPELPLYYSRWRDSYWRLEFRYRISAKQGQKPNVSLVEDCQNAAQILRSRFNTWLMAEEFRHLREKWLERLSPDDTIRLVVQTEDSQLRRLPWNLLDLLDRYPRTEIALSALNSELPPSGRSHPNPQVHILSILGHSEGIDTQADRVLLESLPQARVTPLIEPDRKQLTDQLWSHPWDILFFAGHSTSQGADETGRIFLNPADSLTISELKYALRRAVENGLKLAIFNSCDGLGLARELADLHIPQIIVMREPVPDRVAQEFLKYFLQEYSLGAPLYNAVRAARERLQGLEDRFPCASWLPLICQHPAVTPPTWQELIQPEPMPPVPSRPTPRRTLAIALLTGLAITSLVGGLRFLGLFQPLELMAFDQMLRLRPQEAPDPRLLVITIDDDDLRLQKQGEVLHARSIGDQSLTRLLTLLNRYQPRAIGLDIYRDQITDATRYPDLAAQLKGNETLIAICKIGYDKGNPYGIQPPPEIPQDSYRVGFSDFVMDRDEVVRRSLLAVNPSQLEESRCQVPSAFSVELALRYLEGYVDVTQTGFDPAWGNGLKIRLDRPPDGLLSLAYGEEKAGHPSRQAWQPQEVLFPRLQAHTGGYQLPGDDYDGSQILLNYRMLANPEDVAISKPLRWFLSPQTPATAEDLKTLIQGKVVLIGVTAREKEDLFKTPFGTGMDERIPGVFVHAHMLSQILSTVLDGRPLLWAWSPWVDLTWIGGWSLVGGLLGGGLYLRSHSRRQWLGRSIGAIALAVGVLYGVCVAVLIGTGGWLPFVPAVVALILAGGGVVVLLMTQPESSLQLTHSR